MDNNTVTLCVTTWKRYDLLNRLLTSAETCHTPPGRIVIFDNGCGYVHGNPIVEIYRPKEGINLGVSAGDNWFFQNIDGFKIVSNDDVELFPFTLTMFLQAKGTGDLLVAGGLPILNAFTLFSINQKVIDTVGYFDESISPNYAYFEDNDFGRRIHLAGLQRVDVLTSAYHLGSGTLKALTGSEARSHDRKFGHAKDNYMRRWGGVPPYETNSTPFNKGSLYVGCVNHEVVRVQ